MLTVLITGAVAAPHAVAKPHSPPLPADTLDYGGGPVQLDPTQYAVFWTPPGLSFPAGYENGIERFLHDVAADRYRNNDVYSVATEYYELRKNGQKAFVRNDLPYGGAIVDNDPLPAGGCDNYQLFNGDTTNGCVTDSQIHNELRSLIINGGTAVGLNDTYLLFLPPDVGECFDGGHSGVYAGCFGTADVQFTYCAYHASTTFDSLPVLRDGKVTRTLVYAVAPYVSDLVPGPNETDVCSLGISPNHSAADLELDLVSHEQIESETDPENTAWYVGSRVDTDGQEVADLCEYSYGTPLGGSGNSAWNQVINGHHYWLQGEHSNRDGGCEQRNVHAIPNGRITISPRHPQVGQRVTIKVRARGGSGGPYTFVWTYGDGHTHALSSDNVVRHRFGGIGSYRIHVVVFDQQGDQRQLARTIKVGRRG